MLYVIPLLLLLVVLVLLKVRSNKNKDGDKSKKTAAKKTATKSSKRLESSSPSQPSHPVTSEEEHPVKNTTTAIDEKFKANIEQLIASRTFHSAEAKINQALNQDNTQHELYLYLVEIHLAQNDDFAIKQLLNYIRSLGLHDIAEQAEEKQRCYVPQEVIETKPHQPYISEQAPATPKHKKQNSNKAFDALIIDNHVDHTDSPQTSTTDGKAKIDEEYETINFYDASDSAPIAKPAEEMVQPETKAPEVDTTLNIPPLEFNFNLKEDVNTTTSTTVDEQSETTDFEKLLENTSETPVDTQQESSLSDASLEFNLDQPQAATEPELKAEIAATSEPSLEFNVDDFQFDKPTSPTATTSEAVAETEIANLSADVTEEKKAAEDTTLDFNLDIPDLAFETQTSNTTTESTEISLDALESNTTSLEFVTEEQAPTTEERQDLAFDLEPVETTPDTLEPSSEATPPITDTALEFTSEPSTNLSADNSVEVEAMTTDPLVQAYPQVSKVDEVELDLQLAARYIELGAFESAKILLARNSAKYTAEQRELSEKLLNKIAS